MVKDIDYLFEKYIPNSLVSILLDIKKADEDELNQVDVNLSPEIVRSIAKEIRHDFLDSMTTIMTDME